MATPATGYPNREERQSNGGTNYGRQSQQEGNKLDHDRQLDDEDAARTFWGYLFRPDKLAAERLDRLLRGIAMCISQTFERYDSHDLTPRQLAAFYKSVGGDYDRLFLDMSSESIACIYSSLRCAYSLQPEPLPQSHDPSRPSTSRSSSSSHVDFAPPTVPALKPAGFVKWQTIQLLLGPEEHVPFLQNSLRVFRNLVDPRTNTPFPKYLPRSAFPERPDRDMLAWHEHVSEQLRIEAEESKSGALEVQSAISETTAAASYFEDPSLKTKSSGGIVKTLERKAPKGVVDGGKLVLHTVQNIANPFMWTNRKKSHATADRTRSEEDLRDRRSQQSSRSRRSRQTAERRTSHTHRHDSRNPDHELASDEDQDSDGEDSLPNHYRSRRPRSQDPPSSPREYEQGRAYFPPSSGGDDDRNHSRSNSSLRPAYQDRRRFSGASHPETRFSPPSAATFPLYHQSHHHQQQQQQQPPSSQQQRQSYFDSQNSSHQSYAQSPNQPIPLQNQYQNQNQNQHQQQHHQSNPQNQQNQSPRWTPTTTPAWAYKGLPVQATRRGSAPSVGVANNPAPPHIVLPEPMPQTKQDQTPSHVFTPASMTATTPSPSSGPASKPEPEPEQDHGADTAADAGFGSGSGSSSANTPNTNAKLSSSPTATRPMSGSGSSNSRRVTPVNGVGGRTYPSGAAWK